jgi:hypothetical protein
MSRWKRVVYVHGKGCEAEKSRQRSDCTCNLTKPEYDRAWVFRKTFPSRSRRGKV